MPAICSLFLGINSHVCLESIRQVVPTSFESACFQAKEVSNESHGLITVFLGISLKELICSMA